MTAESSSVRPAHCLLPYPPQESETPSRAVPIQHQAPNTSKYGRRKRFAAPSAQRCQAIADRSLSLFRTQTSLVGARIPLREADDRTP
ncbi:hypothetical protein TNCV_4873681 [Trichonephila clavipes]|nr:hypothetical protein TNCV_4873681 [Trichonephila clavipes]